jgi:TetR/AcrR family transcriptional regulator, transcriptional repressor for nem operon
MTDSDRSQAGGSNRPRPAKRERLVASASDLLYQQGVERTTLADIATAADVPVGNVYYYFKTKDEIVAAVVETHAQDIQATLAQVERSHRTPKGRLKAVLSMLTGQRELLARYGCPQGTLCTELHKRPEAPGDVARLMRITIDWAEEQFRLMGRRDAAELAVQLMASYQGTALLTNVLEDPELTSRQARLLERWIDTLG